jgi:hypothetical protein
MKIFVMGRTHSGKTPFARRLAESTGATHLAASAWVRERFPAGASVDAMTSFATEELRRDPQISAAHLARKIATAAAAEHVVIVIEGVRNPYDLAATFDPREDRAVFLRYTGADAPAPTTFEQGLEVIRAYLEWLVANGLLDAARVTEYAFAKFGAAGDSPPRPGTLEHAIVDYAARVPPAAADPAPAPKIVHAQIPPIRARVRAEHLYGLDPSRVGQLRDCTVFSISSYAGSAPTFQILLDDGAVFTYLPPSALLVGEATGALHELADLVYHDCKSTQICVHVFDVLRGPVLAYLKRKDLWIPGTYLFSVDWYTTNEMLHGVALANGQLALLPSHKIKFGEHPPGFEPYKKIRREWKVAVE